MIKKESNPFDKAIQETLRICKEQGILKDYLEKHESDVTDILTQELADRTYRESIVDGKDDIA